MAAQVRIKWMVYTVLIGLLPIVTRYIVSAWTSEISPITPHDLIAFGFVLHISILNEIEHSVNQNAWKTWNNGTSIAAIFLYGVFTCALLAHEAGFEHINLEAVKNSAMIAAGVSFLLSLSVFLRPKYLQGE